MPHLRHPAGGRHGEAEGRGSAGYPCEKKEEKDLDHINGASASCRSCGCRTVFLGSSPAEGEKLSVAYGGRRQISGRDEL